MKSSSVIDWLTFSVKGQTNPDKVISDYLRIDSDLFEDNPFGNYGYSRSKSFGNIVVYYAPADDRIGDMGICVSLSGTGCRTFESHTMYENFFGTPFMALLGVLHIDDSVNVSRVDLAIDDVDGLLDLDVIADAVNHDTINSRIHHRTVISGYNGVNKAGSTIYFGASNSSFRIRVYDKAKEMYKPSQPEYNRHWVRFEIVMRGSNANGFVGCFVNSDNLGVLASGILNDKISFIERDDVNISRCSVCKWWLDFVDSVAAIKLVTKESTRHQLEDVIDWVTRQIAPSLSLINDARGYFLIRDILEIGASKRTKQQAALLDDYCKIKKR